MSDALRLWQYDHPYYCSDQNYYDASCHGEFASWADFLAEEGDADMDYNLVFRWDWADASDEDEGIDQDELRLFYMGQRKGLFRSVSVRVDKDEEPAIRAWLTVRAEHMRKLWAPFMGPVAEEHAGAAAP